MVKLTSLRFFYPPSTVSISATDGPICGLDSHDKCSWHEYYFIMSYCYIKENNSRVIGVVTWYGRPNIRQRSVKLMAPSKILLYF